MPKRSKSVSIEPIEPIEPIELIKPKKPKLQHFIPSTILNIIFNYLSSFQIASFATKHISTKLYYDALSCEMQPHQFINIFNKYNISNVSNIIIKRINLIIPDTTCSKQVQQIQQDLHTIFSSPKSSYITHLAINIIQHHIITDKIPSLPNLHYLKLTNCNTISVHDLLKSPNLYKLELKGCVIRPHSFSLQHSQIRHVIIDKCVTNHHLLSTCTHITFLTIIEPFGLFQSQIEILRKWCPNLIHLNFIADCSGCTIEHPHLKRLIIDTKFNPPNINLICPKLLTLTLKTLKTTTITPLTTYNNIRRVNIHTNVSNNLKSFLNWEKLKEIRIYGIHTIHRL